MIEDLEDCLVIQSPHNPNHWWGNFLLLSAPPVPGRVAEWIARFHAAFPTARHVALGFDGTDGTVDELALFAELGYTADAQTVMTASSVHEAVHASRDAELRVLSTDADYAQSLELQVRCRDEGHDANEYRVYAAAKTRSNRSIVQAGHGSWFGAFVEERLRAKWVWCEQVPDWRDSNQWRRTPTSVDSASPDRSCTSPAGVASRSLAPRRW